MEGDFIVLDDLSMERTISVVDRWPRGVSRPVLEGYAMARAAGLIRIQHVTVSRSTRYTIIEYRSAIPEDWIRETIKKYALAEQAIRRGVSIDDDRELKEALQNDDSRAGG